MRRALDDLRLVIDNVEAMPADEAIRWALDSYHPHTALASSFGAEDVVLIDMLLEARPDARIFTLDTGRLHEETHEVIRRVRGRYGRRALDGLQLWITGLRREQSVTRTTVGRLEWDEAFGLLKLNPIVDWTEARVWEYIRAHDLPYNALHDRGFPSIGCAPCTRAVRPGEDVRAGRWWWESPEGRECGLHPERRAGDFR